MIRIPYHEFYQNYARTRTHFPPKGPFLEKIVRIGCKIKARRVIDFGCGFGTEAGEIRARTGWQVIGVDYSPEMLANVPKGVLPVLADVGKPGIGLRPCFDLAYCSFLVHLLSNEEKVTFYANVARILNRGGAFVVLTASYEDLKRRFFSKYFPSALEIDKERYRPIKENINMILDSGFREVYSDNIILGTVNFFKDISFYEQRQSSVLRLIPEEEFEVGIIKMRQDLSHANPSDTRWSARRWQRTIIVAKR